MTTALIFFLVLSVLVFAHEWGHFWMARRFKIGTEEFGFGMPPRIFGFYKTKDQKWKFVWGNKEVSDARDTVYSLNWIPMGGFVKIKGQDGEGFVKVERDSEKEKVDEDSFVNKAIWQRCLVLSAGVFMNIVLAAFLFSICFMVGMPQDSGEGNLHISQVLEGRAREADVRLGDILLNVNDEKIQDVEELQNYLHAHHQEEINFRFERDGKIILKNIQPKYLELENKSVIGVGLSHEIEIVRYGFFEAIWQGVKTTFILLIAIIVAFYNLIKNLITGNGLGGSIAGPVGIANMAGQYADLGFVYLMRFTAMLSVNLAVINFLPFPALDGGHVLFLLIEKLKGKSIDRKILNIIHMIGFFLLLSLLLFVTIKEIVGLF